MFLYLLLRKINIYINDSNFKMVNFVNKMLFELRFRYFRKFDLHFEKQE